MRIASLEIHSSMRLASKERCGAKVKKRCETAETPYKKLLRSPHLGPDQIQKLTDQYNQLNPAELKRRIEALQDKLLKSAARNQKSLAHFKWSLLQSEAFGVDS